MLPRAIFPTRDAEIYVVISFYIPIRAEAHLHEAGNN